MTDKKIRGQNFNHLYIEERENTQEVKVSAELSWDDQRNTIMSAFDALDERMGWPHLLGSGYYRVTIEYHSEDEVEDE